MEAINSVQPDLSEIAAVPMHNLVEPAFFMAVALQGVQENIRPWAPQYAQGFKMASAIFIGEALDLYGKGKTALQDIERFSEVSLPVLRELQAIHTRERTKIHGERRSQIMTFEELSLEDRIGTLVARQSQQVDGLIRPDAPQYSLFRDYRRGMQAAVRKWEELNK